MLRNRPSIVLSDKEVHIWVAHLDILFDQYSKYKNLLSDEEQIKESQFAYTHLKKRYAITHGILRNLLELYLNIKSDNVILTCGEYGKPYLKHNPNHFQFNLSHSGEFGIYGIAKGMEIGVDIEKINKEISEGLENYVFSEAEKKIFDSLKSQQKTPAFFNAWTRKEAILKSMGTGLSKPLTDIEITFTPDEPAKILSIKGDASYFQNKFHLQPLDINLDYAGAVAAKSSFFTLKLFDYNFYLTKYNEFLRPQI